MSKQVSYSQENHAEKYQINYSIVLSNEEKIDNSIMV